MVAVGIKKLTIAVAIGVMVFSFFPVETHGQISPDDEMRQNNQDLASTTATFSEKSTETGKEGAPSAGRRLGFTGYKEDLFNMLSSIGALVAWLGGFLLDTSIGIFTIGMYGTAKGFGLDVTIETMWGVIRDMFNLLFIFGLIYAGFKLILGSDESGSKKMISSIIIAALLINFSLYAAQVVVDFSNVMAKQIHSLIIPVEESTVMGWEIGNISSNFTKLTNLDQLGGRSQEMADHANITKSDTLGGAIVLGLLFTVFYSVLGFVFAAGAFILFSRFIALIFLMIFSPVMFLGSILPKFKSYSDQWIKLFFSQALVAPAFLFMLYLSLRALAGIGTLDKSEYTIGNITIYLMIVTAFIWGSLMVARSMSSWGALQAYNVGSALERRLSGISRSVAGGATAGLAARGLRSTVGWGAQKAAESGRLRDAAAGRGLRGWAARRAFNASSKIGDSTFDVRNVSGLGNKLGIGEGIKGGYKTKTEEIAKTEKAFAEKLGQVNDDDPQVSKLQIAVDAAEAAQKTKMAKVREEQKAITTLEGEKAGKSATEQEAIQQQINLKRAQINQYRGEIEQHKEEAEKAKESVQREKQRRQLGDTAKVGVFTQQAVDSKKNLIKAKLVEYASAGDQRRSELEAEIATAKQELSLATKKANIQAGGYATKVEEQGFIVRLFTGRTKKQNTEAGEAIRDEYQKKIKSKDK